MLLYRLVAKNCVRHCYVSSTLLNFLHFFGENVCIFCWCCVCLSLVSVEHGFVKVSSFFWKIFKIFYLTAKMQRTQRNFD